ncbi:hypothetical protein COHA_002735 [Chlorella ohadii]|uniref:Uncharacterized protein n=1 Tax=Chlorella ohadii TaxID=2649997 RepID=A0AAD5DUD8_9CHLO|nr:hypothetical protein COHA_002735 [Chlorella ohadii]
MASRGEVLPVDGGFKAVFQAGDQQHMVAPLPSAEAAALVLDALEVRRCLSAGLPLDPARLRSDARLPQLARMAGAAALQLSLGAVPGGMWQGIALLELVQQLNSCAAAAYADIGAGYLPSPALLRAAAGQGLLPLVELLLMLLGDPASALEWNGEAGGHAATLSILLAAAPESAAAVDGGGRTPLLLAAAGGNTAAMAVLLEAAPEEASTAAGDGSTPLLAAVEGGHLEAARMLLAAAPVTAEAVDTYRRTALHLAAASNNTAVMQLLLAAAPNTLHNRGQYNRNIAHVAAQAGSLDALQLVVQLAPKLATATDLYGCGPIYEATSRGQLEVVQYLLQQAPELAAAADVFGRVPLHYASRGGHLTLVDLLLAHAPETAHAVTGDGELPLHYACAGGNGLVVSRLLEAAPASIAAVTERGRNVLHVAASHGHAGLVAQLLELTTPATAQAFDSNHKTPLQLAVRAGRSDSPTRQAASTAAVQHLLAAAPAAACVPDNEGYLPLHAAATFAHAGTVRLLLAAAPDTMMARNAGGCIPLKLVASHPNSQAASLLVAACPASTCLSVLIKKPHLAAACTAAFVAAHLPLTDEQWEQLRLAYLNGFRLLSYGPDHTPWESPAQALPAALEHSPAQARQLVRLLSDTEQERLRTFGLCLARLQRHSGIFLPGPLVGKLMALFDA